LLAKVQYYLAHDDKRKNYRQAGRKRCVESGYSHHDRLQYMLEQVEKIMSIAKKPLYGCVWMAGISYIRFRNKLCHTACTRTLACSEDFGLFALGLSIAEILLFFLVSVFQWR